MSKECHKHRLVVDDKDQISSVGAIMIVDTDTWTDLVELIDTLEWLMSMKVDT